jgi:hypothetical protein
MGLTPVLRHDTALPVRLDGEVLVGKSGVPLAINNLGKTLLHGHTIELGL